MAAVATLSFVDSQKVLDSWKAADGPTDDEKIQFANAALNELKDSNKYADNVKQVGVWANQIDAALDSVTRGFEVLVTKYGKDIPNLSNYLKEWKGHKGNWVKYLSGSRDVASKHITLLRRFDETFLHMVKNIKTEQDRKEVIKELQHFIDEKHDDSIHMSQNLFNLKRDIQAFVGRFDEWIVDKGVGFKAQAKQLKLDIEGLQGEIEVLGKKIKDASTALAVCSGLLNVVGIIVSGSVLAAFQAERNGKAKDLLNKQSNLADVNREQAPLAHLKTEFDGLNPNIAFICEKLVLFAEIWSSVRSQAVQFQEHLKGGSGAGSNVRFQKEVDLASEVCKPLIKGLEKYATELEKRG